MKQILEAHGWKMYYECKNPCAKQYYNRADKPGFEVRVKTKKDTFVIVQKNQVIAGSFHAYMIEEKLIKFGLS